MMRRSIFGSLILFTLLAWPIHAQRGLTKSSDQPLLSSPPTTSLSTTPGAGTTAAKSKQATEPKSDKTAMVPQRPPPETTVRWGGHAFIYITSTTGVRVVIDPFGPEKVKYLFPTRLPADVILISSEGEDHSAAERLFGAPQVFRSVTAVGENKANGSLFKGVEIFRDSRRGTGANYCTAFVFTLDGIKFAHLGVIGDVLNSKQLEDIGPPVDVLFLPVGNPSMSIADLNKVAADLKARIIVPITYKTESTGTLNLRPVSDFLTNQPNAVKRIDALEFPVTTALLPDKPTVYVLNTP